MIYKYRQVYHFFVVEFAVLIGLYGLQHYISILGSIILVPLVIVPAMGGSYVRIIEVLFAILLPFSMLAHV